MRVNDVVRDKQVATGISVAELSRRTGIKYEALRTALEGTRGLAGQELVLLCRELDLGMSDFDEVETSYTEAL